MTLDLLSGDLIGVQTLNISLNAKVNIYPPAQINSDTPSHGQLNSLSILSGGFLQYVGDVSNSPGLTLDMDGGFVLRSGGRMTMHKVELKGEHYKNVRIQVLTPKKRKRGK